MQLLDDLRQPGKVVQTLMQLQDMAGITMRQHKQIHVHVFGDVVLSVLQLEVIEQRYDVGTFELLSDPECILIGIVDLIECVHEELLAVLADLDDRMGLRLLLQDLLLLVALYHDINKL